MTHSKQITVTISLQTYQKLRRLGRKSGRSCEEQMKQALETYIRHEEHRNTLLQMRQGYIKMGELNLALANEDFAGGVTTSG